MVSDLHQPRANMHNSKFRCFLALVTFASLTVAACSESASSPTSPSTSTGGSLALTADQLSGTWTLRSIRSGDGAEHAAPANATYTLTLSDNRLSTRADCNSCSGAFTLSGRTLTAGPALACTRAACATMDFEQQYTRLLSGDSTITLSGNTLELSSARGLLRFTR
jgi:heat shock protein HslJ